MEWSHPWVLLGLLLLPGLALWGLRARRFQAGRGWWLAFALRGAGVALLLAALAQPSWTVPDPRTDWVVLTDRSRSMGADALAWSRAWAQAAGLRLGGQDRRAEMDFAGNVALLRGWGDAGPAAPTPAEPALETEATDLEAALRAALADIDDSRRTRIVLLTDGRQTRGDALRAAAMAGERGVPVYPLVPQPVRQPREAWVEDVILPPRVRAGEAFELQAVVATTEPMRATLHVRHGTRILSRPLSLDGRALVRVPLAANGAGLQPLEVHLEAEGDRHRENNLLHGLLRVEAGPSVLIVTASPEYSRPLLEALELQGFQATAAAPETLPEALAGLERHDVIVFDNVPAASFTAGQLERVGRYVSELGGGFVMLGGDRSFGSGGYYGSVLEPVLPVDLAVPTPRDLPYVALVTVIDQSESMASGVSLRSMAGSKLEVAKLAASSAIALLNPNDMAGVVSFNNAALRPVPLAVKAGLGPLDARLEPLAAEGGTDLFLGLEAAIEDLRGIQAMKKHIIALSDGVTRFRRFDTLVKAAAAEGITVTTVYLGYWGDQLLLKRLAEWGKGRAYQTLDAKRIPRIFVKETEIATRSVLSEREFRPTPLLPGHPILQGLPEGPLPLLKGYVITAPKPGSDVVLAATNDTPLLTVHRHGLGRVVAFASDLSTAWGAEWVNWPEYARFAAQMVRWAERRTSRSHLQARAALEDGEARVTVDAFDAQGRFRNAVALNLEVQAPGGTVSRPPVVQVAPGRYLARFAANEPGTYALTLRDVMRGSAPQRLGLSVPYGRELAGAGADTALLRSVAETSGGALLAGTDPAADLERMRGDADGHTRRHPLWSYLLVAMVLLFVIDVAYRQLRRAGG